MNSLLDRYSHWRFKNTFLLILIIAALFYFKDHQLIRDSIEGIKNLGYLGAFIVGIFFVSTFTVVPASVVLINLAKELSIMEVSLLAGLGGVVGDYIIFRFLRDRVFDEIKPVFMKFGSLRLSHLLSTPYFAWMAPVVGALIIASPLPDEIGITLLGISKLKNWQFLTLSLALNCAGIFIILSIAKAF